MNRHDQPIERFLEGMRVLIVAGIPSGALLIGIGSRLAMLALRVTSPDGVVGVKSDDDFIIGRFTLSGTYNLMIIGAAVGIIGAATYSAVSPWLIGPRWFRRLTTGMASGAVGGSMLIHSDGVDFTILKPRWFAIGLFIALPALFGTLIGPAVDVARKSGSWTTRGRRRWALPILCVALFPPATFAVVVAALVFGVWVLVTSNEVTARLRAGLAYAVTLRGLWMLAAVLGLLALVDDVRAIVA